MAAMQRIEGLAERCTEIAFEHYALGNRSVCVRSAIAALTLQPGHPNRRGLLSIIARASLGVRTVDWIRRLQPAGQEDKPTDIEIKERIQADPINPHWHAELGLQLMQRGLPIEGYACLRTALSLARLHDASEAKLQSLLTQARERIGFTSEKDALPERFLVAGDPYGRMQFLARRISAEAKSPDPWVLDVGGGNGFMSILLPDANYVLIEPVVNGLNGLAAPFGDKMFDTVLLTHCLEHIEADRRTSMVLETLRLTRHVVLILGPWAPAEGRPNTEESIIRATNTPWAREHMVFGLPVLSEMLSLLDGQGVRHTIMPHADTRVMYWQYLATHFAAVAGEGEAVFDATAFFQRYFDYRPADPAEPHDFLVTVWVS